jgi:hypothetical protein
MTHHQLEEPTAGRGHEVQRRVLQGHFDQRAIREHQALPATDPS